LIFQPEFTRRMFEVGRDDPARRNNVGVGVKTALSGGMTTRADLKMVNVFCVSL